jgi:hypothetical protein
MFEDFYAHMERNGISAEEADAHLAQWAQEDFYVSLPDELALTFFGHTDSTLYACTPQTGGETRFRCRSPRGTETGQESVAGYAALDVGGVRVRALRIRMVARVNGGDHGTETVDWWLEPDKALPIELVASSRTSRAEPLIGRAHYREDAALHLISLTPQR